MRYLRQNTAVIITVGPFLDKTDGITPESSLTPTNCHIVMTKDDDDGTAVNSIIDTTLTASGGDNDLVHIAHGLYSLELTQAQTNYVGRVLLGIFDEANHCPVFHEFTILPANVYDSLVLGTDLLDGNAAQFAGQTITCSGGVTIPAATLASTTNITAGTIATVTNLTNAPTNGDLTAAMKSSVTAAVPTAIANADALLARDIGSGTGAGDSEERTTRSALRFIRNKWGVVGTTLTVTKEDDTTAAWTATVTTDAAGVPITANDPT